MSMTLMSSQAAKGWLDKAKVKDPGLVKALDGILDPSLRDDEYEKRIAFYSDIIKYDTTLLKSPAVIALGPKVVQMFKDCLTVALNGRKKVEAQMHDAAKSEMFPVKVQIIVNNWNNKPFGDNYAGYVEFRSPGVDVVKTADVLTGNGLDINDLRLRPNGTLYLIIRRRMENKDVYVEGTTPYKFDPAKPRTVMIFEGIQNNKVIKLRAKTTEEVSDKLGVKGSVGIEWKVLKINSEVTRETEYKRGFEQEVEWEVEYGIDSFKSFKLA